MPVFVNADSLAHSEASRITADISALSDGLRDYCGDIGSLADFTADLTAIGFPVASLVPAEGETAEQVAARIDHVRKLAGKLSYRLGVALAKPNGFCKVRVLVDRLVEGTEADGKPILSADYAVIVKRVK